MSGIFKLSKWSSALSVGVFLVLTAPLKTSADGGEAAPSAPPADWIFVGPPRPADLPPAQGDSAEAIEDVEDQMLVQPAVDAVVSLVNQSPPEAGASAPVVEERHIGKALVAMLRKGRSLGLRFSGFTVGKFKGGSAGISGQIGKELVFVPDAKDLRKWKVAVYSVSSYGVGLAAQAGMGYSVGIIFDMNDIEDYKSGFCAVTGLFGNVVDFGVSFRMACGMQDFYSLTKSFVSRKLNAAPPAPVVADDSAEGQVVQVSKDQGTAREQKAFIDDIRATFGDGRPKIIGGSIAVGGGLPMGVILSYQPHKESRKPAEVNLISLQQLINDELL